MGDFEFDDTSGKIGDGPFWISFDFCRQFKAPSLAEASADVRPLEWQTCRRASGWHKTFSPPFFLLSSPAQQRAGHLSLSNPLVHVSRRRCAFWVGSQSSTIFWPVSKWPIRNEREALLGDNSARVHPVYKNLFLARLWWLYRFSPPSTSPAPTQKREKKIYLADWLMTNESIRALTDVTRKTFRPPLFLSFFQVSTK
jgi:hypothetical protein